MGYSAFNDTLALKCLAVAFIIETLNAIGVYKLHEDCCSALITSQSRTTCFFSKTVQGS